MILPLVFSYDISVVIVFTRISEWLPWPRFVLSQSIQASSSFSSVTLDLPPALLSPEFSTGSTPALLDTQIPKCDSVVVLFSVFQLSSEIPGKKVRRGKDSPLQKVTPMLLRIPEGTHDSFLYPMPTKSTFLEGKPPCLSSSVSWSAEYVLKKKCWSLFIWESLLLLPIM